MSCNQKSPGPADFKLKPLVGYKDHDINSLKTRGPEWSMGAIVKDMKGLKTPGPYDVGPHNRYGKYPTIGGVMYRKFKDLKPGTFPGPANYNAIPSTFYRWPNDSKFSMGLKTKHQSINVGPGPAADTTPLDLYKNRSPKYPMFARTKDFTAAKSPGPSDYNKAGDDKTKAMNKSPAYTMRARLVGTPKGSKPQGPGPANYSLMDYNPFDRSPTHHIGGKPNKPACVGVYITPQDNC